MAKVNENNEDVESIKECVNLISDIGKTGRELIMANMQVLKTYIDMENATANQ